MIIKKLFLAGIGILTLISFLSADWKEDLQRYLSGGGDYPGALTYLREHFADIDASEKENALSLMAFLAEKTGALEDEKNWIVEYFETYRDLDPLLTFVDDALRRNFIAFWGRWETSYPLVTEAVFLEPAGENDSTPPGWFEVGINLLNPAYYKVTENGLTLEGGFWPRGFHILRLPIDDKYDRPGNFEYDLDLKTGDLIIRKRLSFQIDVQALDNTFPFPRTQTKPVEPVAPRRVEGEVSLYIGDQLILTSKKLSSQPTPITFKIPGPSAPGTKPYMAPRKNDPMLNSVSIIDALSSLYKLIKDSGKKKKAASVLLPFYKKTSQLSFVFVRPKSTGEEARYRTTVSLKVAKAGALKN